MSDKLNRFQRLVLHNQLRILKSIEPEERDYEVLETILSEGYEIFYGELFNAIYPPMPAEESQFVLDVLAMYQVLGLYKREHTSDAEVAAHPWSEFRGFDGNNETDLVAFVRFLVHQQEKFTSIADATKTDGFNSHSETRSQYAAMVSAWKGLDERNEIDSAQALAILNAANA